jgi:hypothetical protein
MRTQERTQNAMSFDDFNDSDAGFCKMYNSMKIPTNDFHDHFIRIMKSTGCIICRERILSGKIVNSLIISGWYRSPLTPETGVQVPVGLPISFRMIHFWILPSSSSAMLAFSSRMMLSSARPKLNRLMLPYQTIF